MRHLRQRERPDPDARLWMEDGTEFTMLERTTEGANMDVINVFIHNSKILNGDYVITPSYICFEIPEESFLFQLTFPFDH